MLMASLSKCHLCLQYHYSIGKQPINTLMGGISLHSSQRKVENCVFIVVQDLIWEGAQAGQRSAVQPGLLKDFFH